MCPRIERDAVFNHFHIGERPGSLRINDLVCELFTRDQRHVCHAHAIGAGNHTASEFRFNSVATGCLDAGKNVTLESDIRIYPATLGFLEYDVLSF